MNDRNKKPTLVNCKIVEALSSIVPVGEYRVFSDLSQLPREIPSGGSDCQGVILAASTYDGANVPDLLSSMTPNGDVYLLQYFRTYPGGTKSKMDTCLYYLSDELKAWRLHSKDTPSHHENIISGSGMGEICWDRHIPSASSGTLHEYRAAGVDLDFDRLFD